MQGSLPSRPGAIGDPLRVGTAARSAGSFEYGGRGGTRKIKWISRQKLRETYDIDAIGGKKVLN